MFVSHLLLIWRAGFAGLHGAARRAWCWPLLLLLAQPAVAADLGSRLRPLLEGHRGQVAMMVKHLQTGEQFAAAADEPMPTASLIKLAVMAEAYRQVDQGQLDLQRMLTLREEDKVPGSGILTSHFSPGMQLSVRDALRLMIAYSDNTATNLILDQIGLPATANTMETWGYPHTKIHAKVFRGETSIFPDRSQQFGLGSTTAAETVRLLERIYRKQLLSPQACEQMLDHLAHCDDDSMIARSLPPPVKFLHKTGSVAAVRTDAGIMETPGGPIAICVLTKDNEDRRWAADNAAQVLCADIGRLTYDYFNPPQLPTPPPLDAPLQRGSIGILVDALQRTLNVRLSPSPGLTADGDFGPQTEAAVIRFQQEQGLEATGRVTKEMWQALGTLVTAEVPVPPPDVVNQQLLARAPPDPLDGPPFVTCRAWAIGRVSGAGDSLWSHDAQRPLPIASTTKIMTAYLVLSRAEQEPQLLDETVTISEVADATLGTSADVRAGERLSVRDLLYGLLLPSGNDAAVALAEHFGRRLAPGGGAADEGPMPLFVAEMNRQAEALGLKQTHFENPHGLTTGGHRSSAADLLKLTQAALRLPRFREYVSTRQRGCTVESVAGYRRNIVWTNTNRLLAIEGYSGVKTGTTNAAGACLVSLGAREGAELLVVVLGSAASDARYTDTQNLFRWAWQQLAD